MISVFDFLENETGSTAIEYALVAALIGIAAIAAFTALGGAILTNFDDVADQFCTAIGGTYNNSTCTL